MSVSQMTIRLCAFALCQPTHSLPRLIHHLRQHMAEHSLVESVMQEIEWEELDRDSAE